MASKRKSGKRPMEWKMDAINTSDATITNGRIELGLRDDEIAEIWKIDSHINVANVPDAANDDLDLYKALSMDPDVIADPGLRVSHEDLEMFLLHAYSLQQEVGAAGTAVLIKTSEQTHYYNPPILVGTDIGQVVKGDAIAVEFWTRVFFTRRKATAAELNQILLKRR